MKRVVKFPKQYKTVMGLMPAAGRADFKRAMINAIIASEQKPAAVRMKKTAEGDLDV
jgi:hypothetical protein